jgi:hypothetical protein
MYRIINKSDRTKFWSIESDNWTDKANATTFMHDSKARIGRATEYTNDDNARWCMSLPERLSLDTVHAAAVDQMYGTGNDGFCLNCGAEHDACEPDMRNAECESCGDHAVFGASEIMLMKA